MRNQYTDLLKQFLHNKISARTEQPTEVANHKLIARDLQNEEAFIVCNDEKDRDN